VENVCRWPSRQGRLRRLVGDVAIPESSRARGLYAKLPTATLGNERARRSSSAAGVPTATVGVAVTVGDVCEGDHTSKLNQRCYTCDLFRTICIRRACSTVGRTHPCTRVRSPS
jgi:hypothetical protein